MERARARERVRGRGQEGVRDRKIVSVRFKPHWISGPVRCMYRNGPVFFCKLLLNGALYDIFIFAMCSPFKSTR